MELLVRRVAARLSLSSERPEVVTITFYASHQASSIMKGIMANQHVNHTCHKLEEN